MQNEKMQINLAPGMTTAEVILREGAAVKQLEPKAPVSCIRASFTGRTSNT